MPVAFLIEEPCNPGSAMHKRAAVAGAEQGTAWAGLWLLPVFSEREHSAEMCLELGFGHCLLSVSEREHSAEMCLEFRCVVMPWAPPLSWDALGVTMKAL